MGGIDTSGSQPYMIRGHVDTCSYGGKTFFSEIVPTDTEMADKGVVFKVLSWPKVELPVLRSIVSRFKVGEIVEWVVFGAITKTSQMFEAPTCTFKVEEGSPAYNDIMSRSGGRNTRSVNVGSKRQKLEP